MTITSTRAAFNAAFLREIKEDNVRLRELFHEVSAALSVGRAGEHLSLVRKMWLLRDQLAMHFTLENALGYLTHVTEHAPRLCDRARAMVAQHDDLFLEICELIDAAEAVLYGEPARRTPAQEQTASQHPALHQSAHSRPEKLAQAFFAFRRRFHRHEQAESQLLMDVFTDDIGVGD